ncbi:MAG: hypothetical protein ACW99A_15740 [Candidatus Kariarchaeaceae archaeon]
MAPSRYDCNDLWHVYIRLPSFWMGNVLVLAFLFVLFSVGYYKEIYQK